MAKKTIIITVIAAVAIAAGALIFSSRSSTVHEIDYPLYPESFDTSRLKTSILDTNNEPVVYEKSEDPNIDF